MVEVQQVYCLLPFLTLAGITMQSKYLQVRIVIEKTLSGLHFVLARENNSSWEKSNLILKCEVILQGQSLFFCLYCFTKSIYILLNKLKVQMSQAEDCTGIITNLSAEMLVSAVVLLIEMHNNATLQLFKRSDH